MSTEPEGGAAVCASVVIAPCGVEAGVQAAANKPGNRHNTSKLRWMDFILFSCYARFPGRFSLDLPVEVRYAATAAMSALLSLSPGPSPMTQVNEMFLICPFLASSHAFSLADETLRNQWHHWKSLMLDCT